MQYLETQDLSKLFRQLHQTNKTHHLVALVGFFCGARISQTLKLRGEDIFQVEGKWVIKISAAKRGYERLHNLHVDVDHPEFDMTPLIELAKSRTTSLLFGGTSRQYVNVVLAKSCAAVGIHSDFAHSHVLRHSVAHKIWQATHNLGAITHFLAHKSPASALCYLREHEGRIGQDAVDSLQLA